MKINTKENCQKKAINGTLLMAMLCSVQGGKCNQVLGLLNIRVCLFGIYTLHFILNISIKENWHFSDFQAS